MSEPTKANATTGAEPSVRTENDSLGPLSVPADAYWGVHTERARHNFAISDERLSSYPQLIVAYAQVKQAAARANLELGVLAERKADAIDRACQEIIEGALHDQFVLGLIQGGAGTSTNMNVNEVVANRALEMLGHGRGEYGQLHPIDDVNRSQSTNDTYPTALKLALIATLRTVIDELHKVRAAFSAKGTEFEHVLKVGRTQLQDAVPMTLGQEFHGFATTISEDCARLLAAVEPLSSINLGATAIGTGITAPRGYAAAACRHLAETTGVDLVTARDLIESTSDPSGFMATSSALKRSAVKLSKICNDLRLLASGPQAGLNEINLPAKQAGSSIMPGKVNPVIPEVVNQVAFAIVGNDVTVTMAAEAGQLQLNAFEPVVAHSLLQSATWLARAVDTLRVNCVESITANTERLSDMVGRSVGVVTALTPFIGYSTAAALAKTALLTGRKVSDLVVESGLMTRDEVTEQLSPSRLSGDHDEGASAP